MGDWYLDFGGLFSCLFFLGLLDLSRLALSSGTAAAAVRNTTSVMKARARRTEIILGWTGLDWVGDARV